MPLDPAPTARSVQACCIEPIAGATAFAVRAGCCGKPFYTRYPFQILSTLLIILSVITIINSASTRKIYEGVEQEDSVRAELVESFSNCSFY